MPRSPGIEVMKDVMYLEFGFDEPGFNRGARKIRQENQVVHC